MTSPLEIIPVLAEDLHQHWPFLEMGVLDCLRLTTSTSRPRFFPEDIYTALRTKNAEAFIFKRNGVKLAFIVGHPTRDPYTNEPEYFLWIGWSIPMKERRPDYAPHQTQKEIHEFIKRRAREWKCSAITLRSPRKGWARHGFIAHTIEWRMPIQLDS